MLTEVLQDRQGYIWLATGNGLCRFDGYQFKNLHASSRIADSNVLFIEEDGQGRIWFVTLERKLYLVQGDSIVPFRHNERMAELAKKAGTPHGFLVSPRGDSLYLAIGQSGVLCMDRAGHLRLVAPSGTSGKVVVEKNGQFLVTQVGGGQPDKGGKRLPKAYDFQLAQGPFSLDFPPIKQGAPQSLSALGMGEGELLVTVGDRVYFVKNQQWQWFSEMPGRVMHLAKDGEGRIYISLKDGGGLRQYASLEALRQGIYRQFAEGQSIRWWLADRQGGWWLSTEGQGLLYFPNPEVAVFNSFPNGLDKPYAIAVQDGETAFVGFEKGQVVRLDLQAANAVSLPEMPIANTIFDLDFDAQNQRLWAANTFLQYYENGRWTAPPYPEDRGIPATQLWHSPNGKLLFCASQKGLTLVDKASLDYLSSQDRHGPMAITAAVQDASGKTWVAKSDGLQIWENEGFRPPPFEHPVFLKPVRFLQLSPDGALVFSDGKQVFWFKDKTVRNLTEALDLQFAATLSDLAVDARGNIWTAAGPQALCLLRNGETWSARLFGEAQGLPPGNVKYLDCQGDTAWLSTDGGVVRLLANLPASPLSTVHLEGFWVNNALRKAAPGSRFPFDENNLAFRFSSRNYRTADQTRYRYRLHPDATWQVTDRNEIQFFSLGEGRYRLEVQAQNEDGLWGKPLVFPFSIRPPFYRAWWFFAGLFLALGGVAWAFFRYRLKQVQQAAALREQIGQLERSALQAQMNPHFIFNCLNSIQNFILKNDQQQATTYLGTFAQLVRDMLNASVEGRVALEDEVRMLENYLALEKLRFKDRFDFVVEIAEGTDAFDIELPPLLVQPFVENAILHGVQGIDHRGYIRVHFKEKENWLVVTVEDNGRGIAASQTGESFQKDVTTGMAHKSVGMSITQKRLSLLNGNDSTMSVEELKDGQGQVQGTRVVVRVFLHQFKDNSAKHTE